MESTLAELGWIHDCVVSRISYDPFGDGGRSIEFEVSCPDDLGYPPWEGRNLIVVTGNVAVVKCMIWGWVNSPETIDAIRPGVSDSIKQDMTRASAAGARIPSLEFTVSLHSGSSFEIVCEKLFVQVLGDS
jgi:hypothetical protein